MIVRLRTQRIQPLPAKIKEKGKGLDRQLTIPGLGESVKTRDIVIFTRQFATMIDAGLPIVQCLDILQAQATVKPLRKAIQQIKDDVEAGSSFNEALRKHPKLFDELYINMVAAGRDRRHSRQHHEPARRLHGESREAAGQDQGRDDLSRAPSSRWRSR